MVSTVGIVYSELHSGTVTDEWSVGIVYSELHWVQSPVNGSAGVLHKPDFILVQLLKNSKVGTE